MNIADIMTANPITIRVDECLKCALELMEAHQIKHLPVLSARKHLVGILSDRDCRLAMNSPFVARTYWQAALIEKIHIREIMTPAPIVIEIDEPLYEATRLILTHRIGCLPIMRGETLMGIVTRSDLLTASLSIHNYYQALLDNLQKNNSHS
jgi:acetoin utilization protein AcuB